MIVFRSIKPGRPFQSSIFREEMRKALEDVEKNVLKDFAKTTANWKKKPKFQAEISEDAAVGGLKLEVTTDDKVYGFVDKGTKVRRALMTKDFQAKTIPSTVGSFPGKGKVVFISRKLARPGIKARKFSEFIKKANQPELARLAKNALARFARRSGRGG